MTRPKAAGAEILDPKAPPAPGNVQMDGQAKAFTSALLDAAGNGCRCYPCQLLREMGEGLKVQLRQATPK